MRRCHFLNTKALFYALFAGAAEAQFYTLRTGKALAMTALDVIFSPGVLDKVKQEFKEAKLREEKGQRCKN